MQSIFAGELIIAVQARLIAVQPFSISQDAYTQRN
jgi:hypothetical protein